MPGNATVREALGGDIHAGYVLVIRIYQVSHEVTRTTADVEHAPGQTKFLPDPSVQPRLDLLLNTL